LREPGSGQHDIHVHTHWTSLTEAV
jgi:hypothetical protein